MANAQHTSTAQATGPVPPSTEATDAQTSGSNDLHASNTVVLNLPEDADTSAPEAVTAETRMIELVDDDDGPTSGVTRKHFAIRHGR